MPIFSYIFIWIYRAPTSTTLLYVYIFWFIKKIKYKKIKWKAIDLVVFVSYGVLYLFINWQGKVSPAGQNLYFFPNPRLLSNFGRWTRCLQCWCALFWIFMNPSKIIFAWTACLCNWKWQINFYQKKYD